MGCGKVGIMELIEEGGQKVANAITQSVLDEVKRNVSEGVYLMFFDKIALFPDGDTLNVRVPNVFIKKAVQEKYNSILISAIKLAGVKYGHIEYCMDGGDGGGKTKKYSAREVTDKSEAPRIAPTRVKVVKVSTADNGLNPKYRFENYVVGENNDLAVNAARAVVDRPGDRYNPYFVYGGPGLGKTHLIQAIGNEILEKRPGIKVLYVTIETFYHDFVEAMRKKLSGFSDKYRKVDVLIVDDFQFIVGKERSQEEFFHTFNDLHQKNKQIVISSDRLPSQIATVDDRLASRLMMGMPIDIQMPKFEMRCAILKAKAEMEGFEIDDGSVEYIANNVTNNIRELEGKLNQLIALSDLRRVSPAELIAGGYIEDTRTTRIKPMTPRQVVEKTGKFFDIDIKELYGIRRVKSINLARQIAMYMLCEELGLSTVRVGQEFGKDHTTVMHAVKKIKDAQKLDFALREQLALIRGKLYE